MLCILRTAELLNNLTIILQNVDKNHGKYSPMFESNQLGYDEIIKELSGNQSDNQMIMKGTTTLQTCSA